MCIKTQDQGFWNDLLGYWDFGEKPFCKGFDHMGSNWKLIDGDEISGVHCNISLFSIPINSTVSVSAWNKSTESGKVEVYAKV